MVSAKKIARVFEYISLQADGQPIEKTRLNKLLYFAQGHALAELGEALFTNEIDAWDHGPVVAVVWKGFDKILDNTMQRGIADITMSPKEMELILDVWEQYRGFTAKELVDMTHENGTPWRETYVPDALNAHIPRELIRKYFSRHVGGLQHCMACVNKLPSACALPAEEYDPDEDSVWEGMLDDAP